MKVFESNESLCIEDTWWSLIAMLWGIGLLPLLLILRFGFDALPLKIVSIPILLIASGLLLYSAVQVSLKSRWQFDFRHSELCWSWHGPFVHRAGTIAFAEIEKLFIQADSGISPDSRRYRLALRHAGSTLPFTPYYLRDESNYKRLHAVAAQISAHIDTLQLQQDDTIGDLLDRDMRSAALRQARILYNMSAKEAEAHVAQMKP